MKKILLTVSFILITISSFSQLLQKANRLHVGDITPVDAINPSAALDITSTTKGFLPPRMTLTQMNAITPATGLMVYCTDCTVEGIYVNDGTNFKPLKENGLVVNRVAITDLTNNGGSNYTVTDEFTPATGAILVSYEDALGNVISTTINSRMVGASFDVYFGAIPNASGFLNYAFPTANIATVTGTTSTGAKGDKGDKGDDGTQGIQGVKGDKGDKGDDGTNVTHTGDVTGATALTIADNAVDGANISLNGEVTGDMMYFNGTNWVRLAKGTAGQNLMMNADATAPEWVTGETLSRAKLTRADFTASSGDISLDVIELNIGSIADIANNGITIAKTGEYQISAHSTIAPATGGFQAILSLKLNNVEIAGVRGNSSTVLSSAIPLTISEVFSLTAGDLITISTAYAGNANVSNIQLSVIELPKTAGVGTGSGGASNVTHTGDVTGATALTIANNAVTTAKINDDAVTISKIGTAGVSDANKTLTTDTSGNPQWKSKSFMLVTFNTAVDFVQNAFIGGMTVNASSSDLSYNSTNGEITGFTVGKTYVLRGSSAMRRNSGAEERITYTFKHINSVTGASGSQIGSFGMVYSADFTDNGSSVPNAVTYFTPTEVGEKVVFYCHQILNSTTIKTSYNYIEVQEL